MQLDCDAKGRFNWLIVVFLMTVTANPATATVIYAGTAQQSSGFVAIAIRPNETGTLVVNEGSVLEAKGLLAAAGPLNESAENAMATLTVTGPGSAINVSSLGGAATDNTFFGMGNGGGTASGLIDDGARVTLVKPSTAPATSSVSAFLGNGSLDISNGGKLEVFNPDFADSSFEGLFVGRTVASSSTANEANLTIDGDGSLVAVIGQNPLALVGFGNTPTSGTAIANGTITVQNGGDLVIASTGSEAEAIESSSGLSILKADIAAILLGSGASTIGDLTIDGSGSTVTVEGTSGFVVVASDVFAGQVGSGHGFLDVTNGGELVITGSEAGTSELYLGLGLGNGEALIDAGGSVYVDGIVGVSVDSTIGGTEHSGSLVVNDSGSLTATQTTIGVGGYAGGTGLFNTDIVLAGGIFSPGESPGTAFVDGNFLMEDGQLLIEFGGSSSGLFDVLNVTGSIDLLGGEILFNFVNGFVPETDDLFPFLVAGGGISISDSVVFTYNGLAPGFEFSVDPKSGTLVAKESDKSKKSKKSKKSDKSKKSKRSKKSDKSKKSKKSDKSKKSKKN